MEDLAIIELYWVRDEAAIVQTDQKYGALCRRLAFNILSDYEDSEECVNDTWHRAWDTMPPQRPDSLRAYLGRIVRNLSISRLRQRTAQKRGGGASLLLSELEECIPSPQRPEQEIDAKDLAGVISRWLRTLSEDDRALFVRRCWYGDDCAALASEWGLTSKQLAKRMFKLRQALKKYLEREGYAL